MNMQPPYQQPQYPNTSPARYPGSLAPTRPIYNSNPNEPTEPVYLNPYLNNPYELPPPPPKRKTYKWLYILLLVVVAITPVTLYYVVTTPGATPKSGVTTTPGATTEPTISAGYTASDIMRDINNAGIHPQFVNHDVTIWSWTGDTYQTTVDASSSVTFTDDSGCTGYCEPANIGVWVYANYDKTQQSYNDVINDEYQVALTPPTGPTIGVGEPYYHGRCLLLGSSESSVYAQVIAKYCI